ncbi:hypothetical protein ACFWU5_14880 [Nocardia sp. NPDC058640]|uniref:hypothetical protein n=1 Tax=Nocardia sp. NPDC058640 TaxID=3346571 RepID=UPI0036634ECF
MITPQLSSRLRGGGCGVLVGALAVAAHGVGDGGVPRSAEVALLLLVSAMAGVFATKSGAAAHDSVPKIGRRWRELVPAMSGYPVVRTAGALIAGQWAGHFALSATLDHHGGWFHLPSVPMIAAHLVAAFACAALILVAERLYLVASSVVRAVLGAPSPVIGARVARWIATVRVVRVARAKGARCPRAPPSFA